MERIVKLALLGLLILYWFFPIDLVPGPIDDAILTVIYIVAAANKGRMKKLDSSNQPVEALN